MPRKYRPPEARRRKARRSASPHILQQEEAVEAPGVVEDVELAPSEAKSVARDNTSSQRAAKPVKHITRDYSYVRGEVLRIVVVAGFLIVSLAITAILRN